MKFNIEYFNQRVLEEIESWPVGILAAHGREGEGRTLHCFVVGRRIVVLHAFVKKTRSTPHDDLAIARARMKEVRDGGK